MENKARSSKNNFNLVEITIYLSFNTNTNDNMGGRYESQIKLLIPIFILLTAAGARAVSWFSAAEEIATIGAEQEVLSQQAITQRQVVGHIHQFLAAEMPLDDVIGTLPEPPSFCGTS